MSKTPVTHADHPVRIFSGSFIILIIAVVLGYLYGGPGGAALVLLLGVLETSLSFDNAIVNARIVEKLSPFWQKIFLTVGIAIAVFGMRLLFPLVIVGISTGLNPVEAFQLAMQKGSIDQPGSYAYILHAAHPDIAAFGGMFLLMLFLDWLFDVERDLHWIRWIEAPLAKIGQVDRAPVIVGAIGLLVISRVAHEHTAEVMVSGATGLVVYLLVNALGQFFEKRLDDEAELNGKVSNLAKLTGKAAFASFIYLEVLDASFSFDGVIGAFAITTDPIIIALGLGAGALFVRSLTILFVKKGTLDSFVYLEHGAHWAIGVLATILIASIAFEIPDVITGLIGVVLIVAALISSVARNKKQPLETETNTLAAE